MLAEKVERIQAGLLAQADQIPAETWALIRPCVVDLAGLVEPVRELENRLEVPGSPMRGGPQSLVRNPVQGRIRVFGQWYYAPQLCNRQRVLVYPDHAPQFVLVYDMARKPVCIAINDNPIPIEK